MAGLALNDDIHVIVDNDDNSVRTEPDGSIVIDQPGGGVVVQLNPQAEPDVDNDDPAKFYQNIADHLVKRKPLVITAEWARRPIHILDLAVRSAKLGKALKATYG